MKTSDKILTFTAIFISCLALSVSIVQTRIMQKQSQAEVWPRLGNGQSFSREHFVYSIQNKGVGPAIIKDVLFTYKDTSFTKTDEMVKYFGKLESKKNKKSVKMNFKFGNLYENEVLTPTEKIDIFTARDSTSVNLGLKYLLETDIKVKYCSIYNTCFVMENDDIIDL